MKNSLEKTDSLGSLGYLGRFINSLKLTFASSIFKYKIIESFWFLDTGTHTERIKLYLIGLKIFLDNDREFYDFKDYHLKRKIWIHVSIVLFFLSFAYISFIWIQGAFFLLWKDEFVIVLFVILATYFGLAYAIFSEFNKKTSKMESFFNYIDIETKRNNYDAFLRISEDDQESLDNFYCMFKDRKNHENIVEKYQISNQVLLIAIDFFIGKFGSISDFRNESIITANFRMNVTGFDKFISKITNAHPTTVQRFFDNKSRGNTKIISKEDIWALNQVKNLFLDCGLRNLVKEVDEFIKNGHAQK
jgi:hypothetical protein